MSDCDRFCQKHIIDRKFEVGSKEEYAFLLGYYAHLLTDATFQAMIRDRERVKSAWLRIKECNEFTEQCEGMPETWDSIKLLFPKKSWMEGVYNIEAEYLQKHPDSGYFTEILSLKEFPDYIDYLPTGCIVRKIGVMGYIPKSDISAVAFLPISREEYEAFIDNTVEAIVEHFGIYHLGPRV